MELKIYAKNINIDDRTEEYIRKKFDRLKRHLSAMTDAKLEVSHTSSRSQNDRVVAQMTLAVKGNVLRAQERGVNLFAAIDSVADVLDGQIRRFKTRAYRSEQSRRAARAASAKGLEPGPSPVEDDAESEDESKVVRAKRFRMSPMSVADAIDQMDMLSHEFFLFYNVETDEYNVVYQRRDGDYGIIEPELA
jgi:putative sigma-54 modulation protein